jgi:hypothetical protein
MLPALAMPFNDPDGKFFPHLEAILPDLKSHFARAYLTIPDETANLQAENVSRLTRDQFFYLYRIQSELPVGDHFSYLYTHAAMDAHPEQILHLCFLDRLAFALRTSHCEQFLADIDSLHPKELPLIFYRSEKAWASHPKNYFELEGFITTLGQKLFSKTLDYGWCHFVIQAKELREVMRQVRKHDLSLVAEMILHVQDHVKTRDVDWLAWEDPFILSRDAMELKAERENSLEETQKRLSYVIPMVDLLIKFSKNGNRS